MTKNWHKCSQLCHYLGCEEVTWPMLLPKTGRFISQERDETAEASLNILCNMTVTVFFTWIRYCTLRFVSIESMLLVRLFFKHFDLKIISIFDWNNVLNDTKWSNNKHVISRFRFQKSDHEDLKSFTSIVLTKNKYYLNIMRWAGENCFRQSESLLSDVDFEYKK